MFDLKIFLQIMNGPGLYRHVNATKLYLHCGRFAGDAGLCLNFFCFLLF